MNDDQQIHRAEVLTAKDEEVKVMIKKRLVDEKVTVRYQQWLEATVGEQSEELSKTAASLHGWVYAERAYDEQRCRRILSWNGLMTDADLPVGAMIPEYLVAVYQHSCIAVYHRSVSGSSGSLHGVPREVPLPEGGPEAERLTRRLYRTAVRAVYALGLDYGLVRIALAARGKLAVCGVEPFPTMPLGVGERYATAMRTAIGGIEGNGGARVDGGAASTVDARMAAAGAPHGRAAGESTAATSFGAATAFAGASAAAGDAAATPRSSSSSGSASAASAASASAASAVGVASSTELTDDDRIVVGLDVEFVLTDSRGALVPADRYLPRSGAAGHDAAIIDGRVIRALAELRPAPSANPRQLFAHLQRAMRLAASRITDPALAWRAGASPVAGLYTGGHIHLSGVPLGFELLRVLDNYLALPLALLEDRRAIARRSVFGWLGHARQKPHGGFEYRTPASWLVSPIVSRGVLALAKLCAVHRDTLRRRPLTQLRMQKAYYEGDDHTLRSFLTIWKQDITNTPSYMTYAAELEPLIRLLDEGWRWDEYTDIREAWGLSHPIRKIATPARIRVPTSSN